MRKKNQENFIIESSVPTVKDGEVFDPEKEVKNILKFPREKRRTKLFEFQEKLAFQKEGIGELQEVLEKAIRQNPDAPLAKLCESVELMAPQWGLTNWQKELAKRALTKYVEKHNAVLLAREKYPDDKELHKALFGRKPKGELGVSLGPMTVRFHLKNIEDFAYIFYNIYLSKRRRVTKGIIEKSLAYDGGMIAEVLIPELYEAVIIINSNKRLQGEAEIIEHEERHALDDLLESVIEKEGTIEDYGSLTDGEKLFLEDIDKFLSEKNNEMVEISLKRFFIEARKEFERRAEIEIIALFKGGFSKDGILDILIKKNGAYDYYAAEKILMKRDEKLIKFNTKFFIKRLGVKFTPMIKKIAKQVFVEDYPKLLEESVDAMFDLQIEEYSNEKIVALLSTEPLRKWRKVVDRLLTANIS